MMDIELRAQGWAKAQSSDIIQVLQFTIPFSHTKLQVTPDAFLQDSQRPKLFASLPGF